MARAETATLLSLDQWADTIGMDSWQFNQIGQGGGLDFARDAQCQTVWYQYSWQRQWLSREEIAHAVASAEAALVPLLNFYPSPAYVENEEHLYPHDARLNMPNWLTPQGRWKSVGLDRKFFCEVGTRERTLIEANVVYVKSDSDGDSVEDTFTLTVNTTETNPDYIGVYFNSADRANLDETWRIRPVQISISSGIATITGKLPMLVDPALQKNPNPDPLSVADSIYIDNLDIYQVKPDTDDIGTAYWNRRAVGYNTQTLGLTSSIDSYDIASAKDSYIRPVISGCYGWNLAPDRVEINYLSGIPLVNGRMNPEYAQMIAYLSCAYLPEQTCGCERTDQILAFWRSSPTDGEQGQFPITIEQINELGLPPVRGGFYAYQQAERLKRSIGLSI